MIVIMDGDNTNIFINQKPSIIKKLQKAFYLLKFPWVLRNKKFANDNKKICLPNFLDYFHA